MEAIMKKIISLALVSLVILALLVSCGAKEKDYTFGIGIAQSNTPAKFSVVTTAATVVLDAEGKVVLCRLDSVDASAKYEDGALVTSAEYKTKAEQGDDYGMLSDYGSKLAEWHTQAEFFEKYVVGKTRDQIAQIKTGDADLVSGCTIDVADFVKAIVAACDSDKKVSFSTAAEMTSGLSIKADVSEKNEKAIYNSDISGVVVADGKVVAALIDSVEATIEISEEGEGQNFSSKGSKLALGDAYGMVEYGNASAEWYAQVQNYANTAVGKTVSELEGLATKDVAGCTISVEGYKKALVSAGQYAR